MSLSKSATVIPISTVMRMIDDGRPRHGPLRRIPDHDARPVHALGARGDAPTMTDAKVILTVAEAAEAVGIALSPSQARLLADELANRFPGFSHVTVRPPAQWRRWTPEAEERLRELYESDVDVSAIAEELGRTRGAILGAASRLRLQRSEGNPWGHHARRRHRENDHDS